FDAAERHRDRRHSGARSRLHAAHLRWFARRGGRGVALAAGVQLGAVLRSRSAQALRRVSDAALITGLGTAAGCIAAAVLALYPVVEPSGQARWPVWLLCALLLFWTGHMWLMAHRGRIHDDPVAFALRDPLSRGLGVITLGLLVL